MCSCSLDIQTNAPSRFEIQKSSHTGPSKFVQAFEKFFESKGLLRTHTKELIWKFVFLNYWIWYPPVLPQEPLIGERCRSDSLQTSEKALHRAARRPTNSQGSLTADRRCCIMFDWTTVSTNAIFRWPRIEQPRRSVIKRIQRIQYTARQTRARSFI